jgi:hypothetical protein
LKGYKDWGAWNLMGSSRKRVSYSSNLTSHNGTPEEPIDFQILRPGSNNYSSELDVNRFLD